MPVGRCRSVSPSSDTSSARDWRALARPPLRGLIEPSETSSGSSRQRSRRVMVPPSYDGESAQAGRKRPERRSLSGVPTPFQRNVATKILIALRAASFAALALISLAVTPTPVWADAPDAATAGRIEDARQAPLFGDTDLSDARALCIEECTADRTSPEPVDSGAPGPPGAPPLRGCVGER